MFTLAMLCFQFLGAVGYWIENNLNIKFDMVAICNITKNNEKKQTTTPHMLLLMACVLQSPYIRLTEVKNNIKGQQDMDHYPFVVHRYPKFSLI